MAADQLPPHVLGHLGQRAGAALLEQEREEVHLEEHVAELVEQLRVVVAVRGGGELVRLLDGVRDDRALVLLAVPGALAPQPAGQRVEARDRGRDAVRPARLRARHRAGYWPAAVGVGVGVGLRTVLAVRGLVAVAAVRLVLPALAEVRDERV